ncbi:MAG: arginase family protein [Actinobacteria bacterium]|nr:arginase family protein [Actinomycetota bacterium]
MDLTLVAVPYDLGREGVGSGRGPAAYLKGGAAEALRARGHDVEVVTARRSAPFGSELEAVLDVDAAVAALVAVAAADGRLPLVLAGNCNVTLGVRAGLLAAGVDGDPAQGRLTTIWLDAHGDFNTPETTATGYLDGMPLAMLTGRAFPETWVSLGGQPQSETLTLHAGGRDLDPAEADALAASRVTVVSGAEVRARGLGEALAPALDELAGHAGTGRPPAYLHVDIDVLDPSVAPAVGFPSLGGLTLAELLAALEMTGARFELRALSLTSFAPESAVGGSTLECGITVLAAAAEVAARLPAATRR